MSEAFLGLTPAAPVCIFSWQHQLLLSKVSARRVRTSPALFVWGLDLHGKIQLLRAVVLGEADRGGSGLRHSVGSSLTGPNDRRQGDVRRSPSRALKFGSRRR